MCGASVRSGGGQGVGAARRGDRATSGTSSGWGRGPRHTAGSPSANLTSRGRRKDAARRGGLRRRAAGCRLADDACGTSRGGCVRLRPNGELRRNCRATTGCQYELTAGQNVVQINIGRQKRSREQTSVLVFVLLFDCNCTERNTESLIRLDYSGAS